jgi:tetratricopeptide (TPR) repeat protein/tRNA A-37 threonylcarbamoyl transferase component Bud32
MPNGDYPELLVVDPAHYVITREIARGGMGRIHVARDRRLGREVAVKEVLVSSGTLARRLEREARITAQLQHPSIVSVHEAGTWPSGEPFYAMRLVQGRSLDEVISAARSFEERLALLPNVLAIADAMAYAHGQHVIHRDLKPRNVVVGEFGETVVIDWGLAKHLSQADTLDSGTSSSVTESSTGSSQGETTAGDVLGTPAYMPPEQAAGDSVDERADVYAIGSILYHLLAGRPPFVADSNAELIAAVNTEPPRPVLELAPAAPRELVTIVERAMARDPSQRYPTARALAEDLRRFQTGQLVGAHRYSLRQLVRRWLRRHRTLLAAFATAAIVAIGVGVFALTRIFAAQKVAEEQRALALANQTHAEELMAFMLGDLRPKLEHVGKLDLLDAVSRRAATYYDARGDTGSDEDRFLSALARNGIAKVMVARGDLPGAIAQYEKSKATLELLVTKRPELIKYEVAAIQVQTQIGQIQSSQGDLPASLATQRSALARAEHLRVSHPIDGDVLHAVYLGHSEVASVLVDRGDVDGALAENRSALALAISHADREQTPDAIDDLATAYGRLGAVLVLSKQDPPGALAAYRTALEIGERQVAKDPKDVLWLTSIATSRDNIGRILLDQKNVTGALAEFRASLSVLERIGKVDPSNTEVQYKRSILHEQVGKAMLEQKDIPSALAAFQAGQEIGIELAAMDPSNTDWQRGLSVGMNKLGDVQLATNDPVAALASYRSALAIREKLVAKDPTKEKWRRDLFYSHIKLATYYGTRPDKHDETIAELRKAISIAEESVAQNPTNSNSLDDLMNTRRNLGVVLIRIHDLEGARAQYVAARVIATQLLARPNTLDVWKKQAADIDAHLAELDHK